MIALESKKKILILTDWFAPGYKAGGPIQSCVNICRALYREYDIWVLTTDTDHGDTEPYPEITGNAWTDNSSLGVKIFYAKKKSLSAKQLRKQIINTDADMLYLNHLFSPLFVVYPLWLKFTNAVKAKVIVCPRGALYNSALSLKSYKKKPLLLLYKWMGISKKVLFHATNQREKEAILQYFSGSRVLIADNLPDINQPLFEFCKKTIGELKCIFASRIVPIKNLLYLLQCLNAVTQKVSLTVIGPVEDETYWTKCLEAIKQLPQNITVQYLGAKNNNELGQLIRQHHLFILPTTGENFGHAIFEAMLAGRPVLISDQTPWLNLKIAKAGWDYSLNNPGSFTETINAAAFFSQEEFDEYAKGAWQYAHIFISKPDLITSYKNLFQ